MEKDRTLTIPVDWIRVFLVKKKGSIPKQTVHQCITD